MGVTIRRKKKRRWQHRIVILCYRVLRWAQRRLPPGLRSAIGILLMAAGILGFLPILGFWMFPLGVAITVTDFPPLRRRLETWLNETRRRYHMDLLGTQY